MGTPVPTQRHPHLKQRANVWLVRVSGAGTSPSAQVEDLLAKLEMAREDFRILSNRFEGIFWCLLDMEDDEKGPTVLEFSATQVARIAALGARLCIEVTDYR